MMNDKSRRFSMEIKTGQNYGDRQNCGTEIKFLNLFNPYIRFTGSSDNDVKDTL